MSSYMLCILRWSIHFIYQFCFQMVRRCVVGGCSNSFSDKVVLHSWPKNPAVARRWDTFVKLTRKDWTTGNKHSCLCSVHFNLDLYKNYHQWQNGFSRNLYLNDDAIPSKRQGDIAPFQRRGKKHSLEESNVSSLLLHLL